jgi:hypothetical protein
MLSQRGKSSALTNGAEPDLASTSKRSKTLPFHGLLRRETPKSAGFSGDPAVFGPQPKPVDLATC